MASALHPITSESVVEAAVEITPWIISYLLIPLTHLGSVLIIVPALGLAYLKRPQVFAPWLGTVGAYYGIMAGIKSLNSASRPEVAPPVSADAYPAIFSWWYQHATSITTTSFPSGNAMVAVLIAGLITIDLDIGTMRQRALVTGGLALSIAYSRVAIGVHYPIDAFAGVLLGLALLGASIIIRRKAVDEVAAMFALGTVCAMFAMWVTTPMLQPPSVESITGSNRPIAFAATLGGLVGWRIQQTYADRLTRETRSHLTLALVVLVIAVYVWNTGITNPVIAMGQAFVIGAALVALPWVLPSRTKAIESTPAPRRSD